MHLRGSRRCGGASPAREEKKNGLGMNAAMGNAYEYEALPAALEPGDVLTVPFGGSRRR